MVSTMLAVSWYLKEECDCVVSRAVENKVEGERASESGH